MKRHLVVFLGRLALKVVIVGVLLSLSWSNASAQEEDMECEEHVLEMDNGGRQSCPGVTPSLGEKLHRSYILCVPSKLKTDPEEVPLLVVFHGGTGSAIFIKSEMQWEERGSTYKFITAYPNGCRIDERHIICDGGSWNAQVGLTSVAEVCQIDDKAFIQKVIEDIRKDYEIQPDKIFAFGHSLGGMLVYRLACDMADTFAAIGHTAATLAPVATDSDEEYSCNPKGVSLFHVHNLKDQQVPFEGGGTETVYASARKAIEFWASSNKCTLSIDGHDFGDDICLQGDCQSDTSIELCLLEAGDENDPADTHSFDTYDKAFFNSIKNKNKRKNIRDAFVERFLE